MVTTVTKSIGSGGGRDYSTLQAWEDAIPANLVTADEQHIGECYNDSEFTVGAQGILTVSGHTTDATRNIILRPAAGEGFRDAASPVLRYDASQGVAIRKTGNYGAMINGPQANFRLDGLQLSSFSAYPVTSEVSDIRNCICTGSYVALFVGVIRNCLVYNAHIAGFTGGTASQCTVVRTSNLSPAGTAFDAAYSGMRIENCAVFNFSSFTDITPVAGSDYNCTNLASAGGVGSNNQLSKTYANQFVDSDNVGTDFRLKSGSDCINTGSNFGAALATDILGTARPQGSAYDIGCHEFVAAGQTIAIGLASETDTALAVGKAKAKAVVQATENDTALAVTPRKTLAAGIAAEADTALAVGRGKALAVGTAAETDTAPAVTARKTYPAAQAAESDSAPAVGRAKAKAVTPAAESDVALGVAVLAGGQLGIAGETDQAPAVTARKARAAAPAVEQDMALAITVRRVYTIGPALETDSALAAQVVRAFAVGIAQESASALAVGKTKAKAVVLASETDAALAVGGGTTSQGPFHTIAVPAERRVIDVPAEPRIIVLR